MKLSSSGQGKSDYRQIQFMKKKSLLHFFQISGFFKGMYYPLLTSGALNSLFFGVYGVSLEVLDSNIAEAKRGKNRFHRFMYTYIYRVSQYYVDFQLRQKYDKFWGCIWTFWAFLTKWVKIALVLEQKKKKKAKQMLFKPLLSRLPIFSATSYFRGQK